MLVQQLQPPIDALLHSLSNKLLPIVVFSELALRRCEDTQLKPQLEKIHGAAEQARDLLVRNPYSSRPYVNPK